MLDNYGEFRPPFNQDPPYAPPTVAGGYPYPQQQSTIQGSAPVYVPYPVPVAMPSSGDGVALSSLILGIVSVVLGVTIGWIPFCGALVLAPAIVGLILGVMGLKSERRRWMGIAGIILSIVGLALGIVLGLVLFWL